MGDFIKELNIIDFLGIGVPGCLLILLLAGNETCFLLWGSLFGTECSEVTRSIFLIIAGYVVGMIIQEIGDIIEKGLWSCIWFDPKTYAAYAVGADRIRKAIGDKQIEEKSMGNGRVKACTGIVAMGGLLFSAVILLRNAIESACLMALRTGIGGEISKLSIKGFVPAFLCCIGVLSFVAYVAINRKKYNVEDINFVRKSNPYIQTQLVGEGNASKRTLYDGFRFVMRNLIIVSAIVNLYSIWRPISIYQQVGAYLVANTENLQDNLFYIEFFFSAVIAIMFVRYYHYAFLRYKYSFEDFLKLSYGKKKERKKKKS